MANVLFLGDLHLGHNTICNFRPFANTDEHLEVIKTNYHKVVTKRDVIYLMGDVCFTKEALLELKTWPGQKILVMGNHDTDRSVDIFDIVKSEVYHNIIAFGKYKTDFWLSHCPISAAELRNRFNIHGHVHSHTLTDPRYFNTSCENVDYTPISLHQIREQFEARLPAIRELNEAQT